MKFVDRDKYGDDMIDRVEKYGADSPIVTNQFLIMQMGVLLDIRELLQEMKKK